MALQRWFNLTHQMECFLNLMDCFHTFLMRKKAFERKALRKKETRKEGDWMNLLSITVKADKFDLYHQLSELVIV